MTSSPRVVTSVRELREVWPDLVDSVIIELDLRTEDLDWDMARLDRCVLIDCLLAPEDVERIVRRGAGMLGGFDDLPFDVLRTELYTFDELASVHQSSTLDTRMGAWFTSSSPAALRDTVVRALHDATIEVALARFVRGRRIVGVMGGHAVERGAPGYCSAVSLGRELARAGFVVATGGGPGVMEAANLGAWFAPSDDDALEAALEELTRAPSYASDPRRVRGMCPRHPAAMAEPKREPRRTDLGVPARAHNRFRDAASRSTSRTVSARTVCWRSRARAWCTRRVARAPSRRSSPTARRTA